MIAAGQDVPLTVTAEYNNAPYLPDSAQYRVLGPGDAVLQDWQDVPATGFALGTISVTIPAALNELSGTDTRDPRLVEFNVVAADVFAGTQRITGDYVISTDAPPLILMTNSFQTYTDAIANAQDVMTDLETWNDATMDQRVAAMARAYNFLSRLNYEIYYDYDDIYFKTRASWGLPYMATVGRLYNYSPDDFLALDPDFIKSIRKAQIVEADVYLTGETAESKRRSGILSETIGESSTMFRAGKPLELMVSTKALRYMSGYVKYSTRLTRSA